MERSIASATMCSKNKNKVGEQSRGNMTTMRKGPWTEEEDAQLVWFVRLFGERRWDFLAKASGLKRTGKSCRLRWVNYLHPGLRRGRITPDEERFIFSLHAQYGSRWSRIARSLPGRTDNEIKNYWRTRMRKKAHEERHNKTTASAPSSSSSSLTTSGSASPNSGTTTSSLAVTESALQESSGDDEAELDEASTTAASHQPQQQQQECYSMDQLWNEIAAAEAAASYAVDIWGGAAAAEAPSMESPVWEFCSDYSLWRTDDEEYYKKMLDAS